MFLILFLVDFYTILCYMWCRSMIRFTSTEGTPTPRMAVQSAFLSTESNAAFKSTNATCSGCWNSLWISLNKRNARIASSVERQRVNPDYFY